MRVERLCLLLVAVTMAVGCRGEVPPPQRPKYIVDLSPPLSEDVVLRQYGREATQFFGLKERAEVQQVRPEDEHRTFGFTYYDLMSHGGAHLDASARLLRDGQRPADVPLDKLYGWAHMVDLRWHDHGAPITIADLENYNIKPNEIVLINVGYSPPGPDDWPQYPYLSDSAAQWLAELGIRAIATDMPSIGSLRMASELMEKGRPPEEIWPSHLPFFQAEIPVIQGLSNLDDLLGESRIYFVGFPLPTRDRSGAPMRAAALVFEK